jgi:hypothetical protein
MATIGTDPNGYKRILFVAREGGRAKRKTIRIGKATMKQATAPQRKRENSFAFSFDTIPKK